ncbi:RnfABCDGE type electron transport complex subunit G [Thauera sinica]|uniref:RnfABCDGE type electron transport complex subunit G n=1 Tax=Thauera sinica TaxID=2665146 RepID=A0ABW1AM86_9RHOO|nr:RnfABCDGE type electron transport complex subunit G [Thauera sp. K11]ATE62638.1 electron transporter RnfG [Thauera sp. K11]
MLGFTVVFTALMASAYEATRPAIQSSLQEAQMRLIGEVLPPGGYDNALLDDVVHLGPTPALGLDDGGRVWRARRDGADAALVLEATAVDGYAGRIGIIVAIGADGTVSGVRVVSHKETPGLGDYIDPKKDRNKRSPWIGQFAGVSWNEIDAARWTVKKDGGIFDYRTGATISARAVARIAGHAAAFAMARRDALFSAAPGSTLQGSQP